MSQVNWGIVGGVGFVAVMLLQVFGDGLSAVLGNNRIEAEKRSQEWIMESFDRDHPQ